MMATSSTDKPTKRITFTFTKGQPAIVTPGTTLASVLVTYSGETENTSDDTEAQVWYLSLYTAGTSSQTVTEATVALGDAVRECVLIDLPDGVGTPPDLIGEAIRTPEHGGGGSGPPIIIKGMYLPAQRHAGGPPVNVKNT